VSLLQALSSLRYGDEEELVNFEDNVYPYLKNKNDYFERVLL